MPKFYRAADVFVLPSYWEVQPLGCIEAMACGTPVIATWVGGIPEIIKDHQTGILIPPKNLIELKKALLKIYKNDSLRKRISKNAFRFARLRTWTKIAQETLWVYEEP
jgi:glycosyltransferase involved in cell wall biosynthesis